MVKFNETEQSKIFDNKEFGYWKITVYRPKGDEKGNTLVDSEPTGAEQIPFNYPWGVPAFFETELKPYTSDTRYEEKETKTGYEISFTKYFYKPVKLRPLEESTADGYTGAGSGNLGLTGKDY
ncbi:hypothetical protein Holit_00188 [Hollandina sp. SP2]